MADEVITEDTPDDNGVEMLQHKLEMLKAVNETLKKDVQLFRSTQNLYSAKCRDYEKQISRLVNNMTVGQLKASGVHVSITIPTHEEDYD